MGIDRAILRQKKGSFGRLVTAQNIDLSLAPDRDDGKVSIFFAYERKKALCNDSIFSSGTPFGYFSSAVRRSRGVAARPIFSFRLRRFRPALHLFFADGSLRARRVLCLGLCEKKKGIID